MLQRPRLRELDRWPAPWRWSQNTAQLSSARQVMADPKQLAQLRRGWGELNAWFSAWMNDHPDEKVDLNGANPRGGTPCGGQHQGGPLAGKPRISVPPPGGPPRGEAPRLAFDIGSTAPRDQDRVYETYWTTIRGVEIVDNNYRLLDLTVYGRREPWEDSPAGWPQQWGVFGDQHA